MSSHTKLLFLAILFFSGSKLTAQQTEAKILTLDGAVNMALSNHPMSRNAALNVEVAKVRVNGSFQLNPTNLAWEHGQITYPVKDNRFSVSQSLGSPVTHYQRNRMYKNEFELSRTEQKITQKQLISKVKEAYFKWVYQISLTKLVAEEAELYEEFLLISKLRFELGDSNLLEKVMAETRSSESQRKFLITQEQLKVVTNYLNRYIYSEEVFRPSESELDLYTIKFPEGTSDKFYPYTFKDYYQQIVNKKKIELSLEKSRLFPEISAGYFRQSIGTYKNLQGFQLGVSVPLFFLPQSTKIREAKINSEIAANEATLQTYELEQAIDDLKIKLDQHFINVIYFREEALEQAELLIKMASLQLQKEKIEYTEYLQSIYEAIKIKEAYLNTVLNYNLTAVELEYLLN